MLYLSIHSVSIYLMKNSRQIAKQQTRNNIITAAKKVISEKGISGTTTLEVANQAGIAHGTVFAHFCNREMLIFEVINNELIIIAKAIYEINVVNKGLESILNSYINLLAKEEKIHVALAREFWSFPDELKRNIMSTEIIIRKFIYNAIEQGIEQQLYKPVNITIAVNFLFGTINFYLSRHEMYLSDSNSLIISKKDLIIENFILMLKK